MSGTATPVSAGRNNGVETVKHENAMKRTEAKGGPGLEWVMALTVILLIAAGAYESLTETHAPEKSVLSVLQAYGYLKTYQAAYEPGKGIWRALGWTGSAMMVLMMLYSLRKRLSFMRSFGSMRLWLSAHMFLGIIGPVLVTFHTTFKLHGIIATSFWCMIVTAVFGILGRYIYVQIPRGISGAELGVKEIDAAIANIDMEYGRYLGKENQTRLLNEISLAQDEDKGKSIPWALLLMIRNDISNIVMIRRLKTALKTRFNLASNERRRLVYLLKTRASLIRRKNLLSTSHRMLHYWHVFHIPLAGVMFLIMFLHVIVYYVFRTRI
ncbi:MAG: hypothetical protein HZB22_01850 [Deltaproteobacteria bacterium]|nr:hypothetical protein [Deltaproteobacteria bacterium]